MRICVQCGEWRVISPTKGDKITILNHLRTMAHFAKVYFGGQRFRPGEPSFGLKEHPSGDPSCFVRGCDVYFARVNETFFHRAEGHGKRLWFAAPFNNKIFRSADHLVVCTQRWADALSTGEPCLRNLNPPNRAFGRKVLLIEQTVDESFRPLRNHPRVIQIRRSFGGDLIIGMFGRITDRNYPHDLIHMMPDLVKHFPGLRLIIGLSPSHRRNFHQKTGVGKKPPHRVLPHVTEVSFVHDEMPYVYNACDVIFANGLTWWADLAGSNKVKEAAACGVPTVIPKSQSMAEVVGDDYPLFVGPPRIETVDNRLDPVELRQKLECILSSKKYRTRIGRLIHARGKRLYNSVYAKVLRKQLQVVCEDKK